MCRAWVTWCVLVTHWTRWSRYGLQKKSFGGRFCPLRRAGTLRFTMRLVLIVDIKMKRMSAHHSHTFHNRTSDFPSCGIPETESISVAIPGPCPRNFSSPSHGPCSPEIVSAMNSNISTFTLDTTSDWNTPTQTLRQNDCKSLDFNTTREFELRLACSNALSMCSFQDNNLEIQDQWCRCGL